MQTSSKLTDARIRAAKPGDRDRWLNDGNGLYLRVRKGGAKVFVLRTKRAGKTYVRTLGQWPQYTLKKARLEAAQNAANRRGLVTEKVADIAREWQKNVVEREYRRPHHVEGYLNRAVVPSLGHRKVQDVTPREIADMLRDYRPRGPIATNRLFAITRQLFRYAVEAGYLEQSPAAGLSRKVAGGPERHRDRTLTDDEIRLLWRAEGSHTPLLRFLLTTGQRIGEARALTWSDVRADRWHIPAELSKNKRPHTVHLSPLALEILRPYENCGGPILGTTSPTAVQAWLRRWCARNKIEPAFTPHDTRRTFATRLHDLGVAPHIVERCLNHALQGVMAVYNQADYEAECRAAWNLWAAELQRIVEANHG